MENKQKKVAAVVRYILPPIVKLWIRKITGLENLPKNSAFILAPNHSSYFEHLAIGCIIVPYTSKKLHFIAKKEHFASMSQSTWHRLWSRYVAYIPIDRDKGAEALATATAHLRQGAMIVIYPEGTRSLGGKMQRGKTGIARIVLEAKVPVVPLGIKGMFEIMPKGKHFPAFKRAEFHFGKPIYFDDYYKKPITKDLLREMTNVIMKEIATLSEQEYTLID